MILNETAPAAKAVKESDSSHWYEYRTFERDWIPLYYDENNFDLRDARRLKDEGRIPVPSVTSYFKDAHKQQVVDWKVDQALEVAARIPYNHEAGQLKEWVDDVAAVASRSSRGAADLGTRIHKAIEHAQTDTAYDAAMDVYVQPVLAERSKLALKSIGPEQCVGNLELGYAGKVDDRCEGMVVVDYKSRAWKASQKKAPKYNTDAMQTAAYGFAEWGEAFFREGTAIVIVISTTQPGRVQSVEIRGDDLRKAFDGFLGLMQYWRFNHNFDPRA